MIVYLLTIILGAAMPARMVLTDAGECDRLAKRMIAHDPKLAGSRWTCEALPMLFASIDPPMTPPQQLPAH